MGKDIKGKELGVGISQRSDGFYVGKFTTKYGQRKQKFSANYKSAGNGWQTHNIRTSIAI